SLGEQLPHRAGQGPRRRARPLARASFRSARAPGRVRRPAHQGGCAGRAPSCDVVAPLHRRRPHAGRAVRPAAGAHGGSRGARVSPVSLSELPPECFEGALAAVLATSSTDGIPNAAWVSHVLRVDDRHVALWCQFLNKSRANLEGNPIGVLLMTHPRTAQQWRLFLRPPPSRTPPGTVAA